MNSIKYFVYILLALGVSCLLPVLSWVIFGVHFAEETRLIVGTLFGVMSCAIGIGIGLEHDMFK